VNVFWGRGSGVGCGGGVGEGGSKREKEWNGGRIAMIVIT